MSDSEQEILEQTAIAFFHALRACGRKHHGNDQFGFRVDIQAMSPKDKQKASIGFGADIQEALTVANRAVQPIMIEGTTLK
jgi:hypothetical protein